MLNIRYLSDGLSAELFSIIPKLRADSNQRTETDDNAHQQAVLIHEQKGDKFRELYDADRNGLSIPMWDSTLRGGRIDVTLR